MDKKCYQNFKKARHLTVQEEGQCIVCLDKTEWDVEKYGKRHEEASAADIAPAQIRGPLLAESNAHSSIEVEEIPESAGPSRSNPLPLRDLDDSGSNYSDFHEEHNSDDSGDEQSDNDIYADKDAASPPRLRRRPHTAEKTSLTVSEHIWASPVHHTPPHDAREMITVHQKGHVHVDSG